LCILQQARGVALRLTDDSALDFRAFSPASRHLRAGGACLRIRFSERDLAVDSVYRTFPACKRTQQI